MTNTTPTQVAHSSKAILRGIVQTGLAVLTVIPGIIAIITGQWDVEWLAAVGAQVLAVQAALTKIMALPVVNAWLTGIGLGAEPKQ